MSISSQRRVAAPLREAVRTFRGSKGILDKSTDNLLARLADSRSAEAAFKKMSLDNCRDEQRILSACIKADLLHRTFSQRLKEAEESLERMKRLHKQLGPIRQYVDEVARQRHSVSGDLLSTPISDSRADVAAMKRGLDLIQRRIDKHQHVTQRDIWRLGATRKTKIKQAGQLAATRLLSGEVRQVTGRPHAMSVADLLEVIIGRPIFWTEVASACRTPKRKPTNF
jgi:hypothetical protein